MTPYLTKREQRILFTCIIMVLIYGAYYWILRPLHDYRLELGTKIDSMQKKIYKNLRMIRKSEMMKDKHGKYLADFKQTVSDEQVMSTLIAEIENIAGRLSLGITDLKPQKVKHAGPLNYFSVSLGFNSDSKTLIQFLHTLQDQAHLFYVKEVKVDKAIMKKENILQAHLILSKIFIAP
jgi:hypothetical protein